MSEKQKKILLVEDEPDVSKVVSLRLRAAGYNVVTAENGQEGLDQVFKECPDLIVTDVLMPVMDGFTFYKNLKKSPTTADIPVLVLTARGHMEDSFRVMGADDFLTKPFEHEALIAKIALLLNRSTIKAKVNKKVLVAGSDKQVLENMAFQLKKIGCLPEMAKDGPEIITKVVQFSPDVLIMEVPLYGMAAEEVVKILRQMAQFSQRPILIYNFFKTEDLGETTVRQKAMIIDDAKQACIEAGITHNIGRFNEFAFLEGVQRFLV
ncbi:MAG: response regulator [Candidatus Omnitrophica bacterium]|nr:response regulator [Candidatus Omnitrophota bacterium]